MATYAHSIVTIGTQPILINKQYIPDVSSVGAVAYPDFIDYVDGGFYRVAGTVKEKALPANTPLKRKVMLFDQSNNKYIAAGWSDPITGAYSFDYVRGDIIYYVVAFDYTETYRAVIANTLTPTLIP